jgi:hypothetical protein
MNVSSVRIDIVVIIAQGRRFSVTGGANGCIGTYELTWRSPGAFRGDGKIGH